MNLETWKSTLYIRAYFVSPQNEMRDEKEGIPWISNDHVLISPEGTVSSVYRKIHLFDVDIPEKKIRLKESSYVKAGSELVLTECTPVGRIGLGVVSFAVECWTYQCYVQSGHFAVRSSAMT